MELGQVSPQDAKHAFAGGKALFRIPRVFDE
jgi:hypothetical protein